MGWVSIVTRAVGQILSFVGTIKVESQLASLQQAIYGAFRAIQQTTVLNEQWQFQAGWALSRYHFLFDHPPQVYSGIEGYLSKAGDIIDSSLRGLMAIDQKIAGKLSGSSHSIGGSLGRLWSLTLALKPIIEGDDKYLKGTVVPQIAQWQLFHKVWNAYYLKPLGALVDWYRHPGDLSRRLAPTMAPDVVSQLSRPSSRRTVDALLRLLAKDAQDVTSAIDAGTVALLESGNY